MGIFARLTTKVVDLPFDAPNTVTIRKLSGSQIRKARRAEMLESLDFVARLGGLKAFQKELDSLGDQKEIDDAVKKEREKLAQGFDRDRILQYGVVAWTYAEPITEETLMELTEEASDFLVHEILALTKPREDAVERKNV